MSIESAIDSWPGMHKLAVVQTKAKTILLHGATPESSEGRKRAPWMLQLVFNKILTFHLTNFGLRNMAVVVVGKGGGGKHPPPLLFTLKAIPFQANSYDCG